jgi:hypothetical protein
LPSRLAVFRQQHPEIETTLDIFPAKIIEEKLLKDSFPAHAGLLFSAYLFNFPSS